VTANLDFKDNLTVIQDRAILAVTVRLKWPIDRRHFQWPWTTPDPDFKLKPIFDAEYVYNDTRYTHS